MGKTLDELNVERDTLLEEITKLKEKVSKTGAEKELLNENDSIKAELDKYKELCEKQAKDLSDMTKFTQQVLLDYGIQTKDKKFYNEEKPQDEEQDKLDIANQHLEEYFNQFKGE